MVLPGWRPELTAYYVPNPEVTLHLAGIKAVVLMQINHQQAPLNGRHWTASLKASANRSISLFPDSKTACRHCPPPPDAFCPLLLRGRDDLSRKGSTPDAESRRHTRRRVRLPHAMPSLPIVARPPSSSTAVHRRLATGFPPAVYSGFPRLDVDEADSM